MVSCPSKSSDTAPSGSLASDKRATPLQQHDDTLAATAKSGFRTNDGRVHPLPLFLPVYQPRESFFQLTMSDPGLQVDGVIVNAFFLYKQRDLRALLTSTTDLPRFVGFDGLIATDSGAFQGFTRRLYLSNRDIVSFQDRIGSHVIAPLDLVTPPGDTRKVAEGKLTATLKRVREALAIAERGIVAGIQQGGRFMDLRERSTTELLEMGVKYLALGSLVPFFNKKHDLSFVGEVVRASRRLAGPVMPIHVYGAGDPVELPFMVALGATIFDSASYAHYANVGAYMTPFGALRDAGPLIAGEYSCDCSACRSVPDITTIFSDKERLSRHNLWVICKTVARLRVLLEARCALSNYLTEVLERHVTWFPQSRLAESWNALNE
jgi:7-cyano-7-deazaguanine tRNA-ribosyltransferase